MTVASNICGLPAWSRCGLAVVLLLDETYAESTSAVGLHADQGKWEQCGTLHNLTCAGP